MGSTRPEQEPCLSNEQWLARLSRQATPSKCDHRRPWPSAATTPVQLCANCTGRRTRCTSTHAHTSASRCKYVARRTHLSANTCSNWIPNNRNRRTRRLWPCKFISWRWLLQRRLHTLPGSRRYRLWTLRRHWRNELHHPERGLAQRNRQPSSSALGNSHAGQWPQHELGDPPSAIADHSGTLVLRSISRHLSGAMVSP